MTDINKQKFLTELGKLLTFMYEEDRRLALSIYDEVFEQAEDEQAVLSALASPTRQAVIIARAYNAKERKLQIYSQSRDDDGYYTADDRVPDFVLAIEDAVPFEFTYTPHPISEEQLTELEENTETVSTAQNDSPASQTPEEQSAPAEDGEEAVRENQSSEGADEAEVSAADSRDEAPEECSVENSDEETSQEENSDETDQADAEKDTDSSPAGNTEDKDQAEEPDTQAVPENEEGEAPARQDEQSAPVPAVVIAEEDEEEEEVEAPRSCETVSKPRIFLLILYIIFAVPITAVGILLLLIPTLLSLALAVAFISAGSVLLAATFSGFAVFADIMVMLGAALIVLALGLLVLWLFIWFIGGAMASLVHSVLDLAHKWCYKEVPAV